LFKTNEELKAASRARRVKAKEPTTNEEPKVTSMARRKEWRLTSVWFYT